jgi:competence protein ComEC
VSPRIGLAGRFSALVGLALGLALSPAVRGSPGSPIFLACVAALLVAARPRGRVAPGGAVAWVSLIGAVACLSGVAFGAARLAAIDAGALLTSEDQPLTARGTVVTTPKASGGRIRFVLEAPEGRIGVETAMAPDGVDEGSIVHVRGTARTPAPWDSAGLARQGATRVIMADEVRPTGTVRGGVRGALDGIRRRAETALERGTPETSAALLRGFVLGQDDRIAEPVRDEFRRSGLAHVLAVSGQNVMLLALLATPILALAGVPIRLRLWALVGLIAVYVPVAGAGPSIQRAGVMGAAGLVAALAGRPRARWYALVLAAVVTLAINPRATGDIGWQLSFAAVAGLLVVAGPVARVLAGPTPRPGRRLVAEGAAMTLAATLATAPLAAHHFGTVSLTAIPANLLALPAIAPAMWLGMLAGALGQVSAAPVEPLTALGGLCAGYIGWVARVFGGEGAQLEITEPGLGAAIAMALGLLGAARLACLALERRSALGPGWRPPRHRRVALAAGLGAAVTLALLAGLDGSRSRTDPEPPAALVIRFLDVGQGDATLLQPRGAPSVLVDTGPPGDAVASRLSELGIDDLGAVLVTHDQLDHSGGLSEVLAQADVRRIVHAGGAAPQACRSGGCPPARTTHRGQTIRSGRLSLEVLWPPDASSIAAAEDPNRRSLVLRARLGRFDALLTGDAEAELAPLDPGPVDVLKVAHHGSEDTGLAGLLARASPRLAVISVGAGNPYGHPAPETLATLAERGVPIRRTDSAGEVAIEVRKDGWSVG